MSVIPANRPSELNGAEHLSWTDLGADFLSYLTRRRATVNYTFIERIVGVPRAVSDCV